MAENSQENSKQNSLVDKDTKDNNESSENSREYSFIKNAIIGDIEISINHKKQKNPVEILQELHKLHHDVSLSNAEKNTKAREIMKNYMR